MSVVSLSGVSAGLFLTGVVFILLIGSFLSLGVMRFFQLRKKQGGLYLSLSALSFVLMIIVVNTWFAE